MNENLLLIQKIYDAIENRKIDKTVFLCIRLSRNINDIRNTVLFLHEIFTGNEFKKEFALEVIEYDKEFQTKLHIITLDDWISSRTLSYSLTDDPKQNVMTSTIGEIQSELKQLPKTIENLNIPTGMEAFDAAAFTDRYDEQKSMLRLRYSAITSILEGIRSRALSYASRVEKQIKIQKNQNNFLDDVQNKVNNYFYDNSEDIYLKLQKASNLVKSTDIEDASLLLTIIRKILNSVSDYYYPPKKESILCSDGITRKLGKEQYLNRLFEFCNVTFDKSTSKELIKIDLEFAKKLNDIASKGVHTNSTFFEAKQGLVGIYMLLFNIIQKIEENNSL